MKGLTTGESLSSNPSFFCLNPQTLLAGDLGESYLDFLHHSDLLMRVCSFLKLCDGKEQ